MKRLKIIFLSLLISLHINAFDEFLVSDIRIVGLQRVSTGSIFNVIPISVGAVSYTHLTLPTKNEV